ncbi:hypothetical protein PBI_JOSHKAYV_68 [Mycobacterium phage JoshKayV]|uniref:Lipoprotein n=1 Tax=Mycobacterium phage JoshKayV TaxID=2024294 RepID=A0A249XTT8_9CAUD|nr:hypothetical protein KIY86_gp39 [Mycobacterium phage JoshKayV]ASZ75407.1 hypothetical protein PBI_JOSHKAYV_68 [Mycobacterium phage JoshKayV]
MKKIIITASIAALAVVGLSACDDTSTSCGAAPAVGLMSVEKPLAPSPRVPSIPRPPSPRISSPRVSTPHTTINNYGGSGTSPLLPFLGGMWAGDMMNSC